MNTADEIARLTRSLHDADPEVRSSALISLAEIKKGVPAMPILPLLGDPDEAVRAAAAFALSKVGDAAAVPALVAAWNATRSSEHHLRRQIVIALGDIGGAEAIEPVVDSFARLSAELQELSLDFIDSEPGPSRRARLSRLLDQDVSRRVRAKIKRMLATEP